MKSSLERVAGWDAQKYSNFFFFCHGQSTHSPDAWSEGERLWLCVPGTAFSMCPSVLCSSSCLRSMNSILCHLHLSTILSKNHILDVAKSRRLTRTDWNFVWVFFNAVNIQFTQSPTNY